MDGEERGGFLPPEPAGPEPELAARPAASGPAASPPPAQSYAPPAQAHAPPPGGGWAPPPGPSWQPAPQPWGYAQPQPPDNNPAVAGFVLSLVSLGLLLFSAGLSSIVSVGCSIAAIVLGRKGVRKVDAGETPKQRSLAQAGFWIGIGGLVLAVLATLAWIAFVIVIATNDEARQDFENEFDESRSIAAAVAPALRLVAHLVT